MPLPGGATGFTLTGGPYDDPAFEGMVGKLTTSVPVTHVATGERLRTSWTVTIDYSGNFSVGPLPFSDDPAFTPTGFTYTMTWQALSYKPTPGNLTFAVPTASGSTVDFDTLAAATPGQPALPTTVFSVNGHAGAVSLSASDVGADASGAAAAAQTAAVAAAATDATTKANAAQSAATAAIPSMATIAADPALRAAYVPRSDGASFVKLTGTAATDTAAIQAAINTGGHIFLLGNAGTFTVNPLQIKSGADLDLGGCTLKLANGANTDLITVPNFGTLTGGNTSGGESQFGIRNGVLDGNGTNQTGTSWTFRVYAFNYRIDNVEMINGLSGNAYSEWGNSAGGDMEAVWTRFKLRNPIGDTAIGLDWHGPHDSIFQAGEVVANTNAITMHQTGIWSRGNAGAEVFSGVHVWGFHQNGWIFEHSADCSGCEAEGAYGANVLLNSGGVRFAGRIFGTAGINPTEVGVQFGDVTHTSVKRCDIWADFLNFNAGAFAVNFFSDGGANRVRGTGILGTSTAFFTGTRSPNTDFDILGQDGTTDQSTHQHVGPLTIKSASTTALSVGPSGTLQVDATNNHVAFRGGGLTRGYSSGGTNTWFIDNANGCLSPGTPTGSGGSRIFSGSGAPTLGGAAGDFYFRKDGGAGTHLYFNTASGVNWVALV